MASPAHSWLFLDVGDHALAAHWLEAATEAGATDGAAPLHEGGSTVASGLAMLRATLAYKRGDLETARESAEAGVTAGGRRRLTLAGRGPDEPGLRPVLAR